MFGPPVPFGCAVGPGGPGCYPLDPRFSNITTLIYQEPRFKPEGLYNMDCVYSDTTLNPRGAAISHSGTKYFPEA